MIANIQGLRTLAAMLVIFVHLDKLLAQLGLPPFGWGGVDVFFVISGFIMVHTTYDKSITSLGFIKNRIVRIAPLYWLCTLGVFAIALFEPHLLQATRSDFVELLKSILFIPFQKSNGLVEPVLFVGWTINYEMAFYVLFAFSLQLKSSRIAGMGLIAFLALLVLIGMIARLLGPMPVLFRFYTSPLIGEFALGMALGLLYPRIALGPSPTGLERLAMAALALSCVIALIVAPYAFPKITSLISCGLPATLLVALALLAERRGWRLQNTAILKIGAASYALYLTHPFVVQAAQKLVTAIGVTGAWAVPVLVCALGAAVLSALLVHRSIEQPLTAFARRI